MNSRAAFPPSTSWHGLLRLSGLHVGGFSEGKRACTVSMIKPCNKCLILKLLTISHVKFKQLTYDKLCKGKVWFYPSYLIWADPNAMNSLKS